MTNLSNDNRTGLAVLDTTSIGGPRRISRRTALLIFADMVAMTSLSWCKLEISATPTTSAEAASPRAPEVRAGVAPNPAPALSHGPLLGSVTDSSIRIWARGERSGSVSVQIRPHGEAWPAQDQAQLAFSADRDLIGATEVTGLRPATRYEYRLLAGRADDASGAFTTLPEANSPSAFRFTIGGDLSSLHAPFAILGHVIAQQPLFNVLLGDLVYSDSPTSIPPTTEAYRAKYRQNWSDWHFRELTRSVPSFMMWDDHEIINDYDGGDPVRYAAARVAMEEYATVHNPPSLRSDCLYYSFGVADVGFFVTDTRSYRSDSALPDDRNKTMLGSQQKSDLKDWLLSSPAPVKFVLSSIPVHDLGIPRSDAWTGFANERAELLSFIRDRGIPGVVLISGDQHWASLVHHTSFGVWEFNATPLAQSVVTLHKTQDPELILSYDASPSFGVIDVDTRGDPLVTFTIVDNEGRNRGSHRVTLARAGG
jgi:alkaline phosphatase D